ncbi:MAG: hypothetical protein K0Q94_6632, partial [Paenibacillus sp.]|nr:hypothetical protein [Paenibacillus sp.]
MTKTMTQTMKVGIISVAAALALTGCFNKTESS